MGKIIDEDQIYLFNEGRYFYAYRSFGSHVADGGVHFTVWVPGARKVRVYGNFNDWRWDHELKPVGNSGIWTGFFTDVHEGDIYKYIIETDNGKTLEKSDPFAFYSEMRPSTASIVHTAKYEWSDSDWMKGRAVREGSGRPKNIYEVHLGSWKRHDASGTDGKDGFYTYSELAAELVDYVKEMGYTHMEILPVMEHPLDASWGYQVTGFYSPTSRYGKPEDLMHLIDCAHQSGISVILDWVPGHFCYDSHGLALFNGHYLYEKDMHPNWGTGKFDFGRPEVRSFLLSNANYWFGEFHADAMRVDGVSSMLYLNFGIDDPKQKKFNKYGDEGNLEAIEFLHELSDMVGSIHPGACLIAEESTAWPLVTYPPKNGGLGFNYKWDMGWMHDTLNYFSMDFPYRPGNHNLLTFSMMYAYSENFVLPFSHDEIVHGKASLIGKMPGDYWRKFAGLRLLMLYQMTHPGAKLNFMGNELAQWTEWHEYESVEWFLIDQFEAHRKHHDFVKALNKLYLNEKALWEVDHSWEGFSWIDANNGAQCVASYIRMGRNDEDNVYVVLNCEVNPYEEYRIGVDSLGTYYEIFNTDSEKFGGSGVVNTGMIEAEEVPYHGRDYSIVLRIPPLGATVLKRKKRKDAKELQKGSVQKGLRGRNGKPVLKAAEELHNKRKV